MPFSFPLNSILGKCFCDQCNILRVKKPQVYVTLSGLEFCTCVNETSGPFTFTGTLNGMFTLLPYANVGFIGASIGAVTVISHWPGADCTAPPYTGTPTWVSPLDLILIVDCPGGNQGNQWRLTAFLGLWNGGVNVGFGYNGFLGIGDTLSSAATNTFTDADCTFPAAANHVAFKNGSASLSW